MARVLDVIQEYKLLKTKRDFVVVNTNGTREYHSHFDKENAARNLIDILIKKKIPKGQYFLEAAKRVTIDKEYNERLELMGRKGRKEKYINCHR
ncbi:hypothetical protein J2Z35_000734 [Acetoanaerobium pronyense]|uniref:Uncharacterized protein n=1 Tax=Acetoanaerobium pronyense TaxID=1482736 RepID=A0ABS4KGN2_9FIRM|nr:hypothetical protein [Acetoanaerobium pronyense]MBP2026942.1 hypothetical protein [Acetoanaerobium pronyense]